MGWIYGKIFNVTPDYIKDQPVGMLVDSLWEIPMSSLQNFPFLWQEDLDRPPWTHMS